MRIKKNKCVFYYVYLINVHWDIGNNLKIFLIQGRNGSKL